MGSASSRLVTRVARLGGVAAGGLGRAAGHCTRVIWVEVRLCARWRVTHLFLLLRTFSGRRLIPVHFTRTVYGTKPNVVLVS